MPGPRKRFRSARLKLLALFAILCCIFGFYTVLRLVKNFVGGQSKITASSRDANLHRQSKGRNSQPSDGQHPLDEVLRLAYESRDRLRSEVRDYEGILTKRERIGGKLQSESELVLKVIERQADSSPENEKLHVYLRFVSPNNVKGREVIWVQGENDGKLIAHESGILNLVRAKLDPQGTIAMLGNKYPVTDVGLSNLVHKLISKGERDRSLGPCLVDSSQEEMVGEVNCRLVQVSHPERLEGYDFHLAKIWFDTERMIPLKYASYLWPEREGDQPPLEEEYTYTHLRLNVGLSSSDFDPENANYNYP